MSNWFKNRRHEFIAATLNQFGQIRRADLMREFDITAPVASADIAAFLAAEPKMVTYDVSAKAYLIVEPKPDALEERPYAYCCAEGGGDPAYCDCVNKNHGTALFPSTPSSKER